MSGHDFDENLVLLNRLKKGDKTSFTLLFTKYYKDLVNFSFSYTNDIQESEELVQDVFVRIWENRQSLQITTSLKSYLLKSVQNRCIDLIRHRNIQKKYRISILEDPVLFETSTDHYVLHSELEIRLNDALQMIAEEYSKPFRMSRFEGLKYDVIAEELKVSVRTVEVRIAKALQLLREELKDFL